MHITAIKKSFTILVELIFCLESLQLIKPNHLVNRKLHRFSGPLSYKACACVYRVNKMTHNMENVTVNSSTGTVSFQVSHLYRGVYV